MKGRESQALAGPNFAPGAELGIYVHIPFCSDKCSYCDFNSYAGKAGLIPRYVEALCAELRSHSQVVGKLAVSSVFFGGGTPSLLGPGDVQAVLDEIGRVIPGAEEPDLEVTLEANPEDLTFERLAGLRRAGVNRLSIGAQSLSDRVLGLLGRRHSANDALRGFEAARCAGFENINLDLIYGIPGQSIGDWEETLETAIRWAPDHFSCYALTLDDGHRLPGGITEIPEEVEDLAAEMQALACRMLPQQGYRHYEISNFAPPGRECRHNLLYWRNLSWLGIGAGAHSHLSGERWENVRQPETYVARVVEGKSPVISRHRLRAEERRGDRAFLGLRLLDGLDLERFEEEEGLSFLEVFGKETSDLLERGLLVLEDGRLRLTSRGIPLANEAFCRFV